MDLILIRHGQTNYNAERRFQGRIDIPLNALGRKQAHQVKTTLAHEDIRLDVIFSSPLERATETASMIADDRRSWLIDARLIEIDLGEFDGQLEAEIAEQIGPERYQIWRDQNFVEPAPSGESLEQVSQRVKSFLAYLNNFQQNQKIGIVAHQGILMAMKSVISGSTNPSALNSYKQMNDELDIWNLQSGKQIRTVRF